MSTERKPWIKLGSATVFDTNAKGMRRETKSGVRYHQGRAELKVDGRTLDVVVTVMPAREGMLTVHIEQPPEDNG